MKYLKVSIEGFQSIDKKLFDLDRTGINLIKGTNGAGKSTIFNAILWAEYGVNLKVNINTWKDKRTPKYRGTRVIVDRIIGDTLYRIARHSKFKGTTAGLSGADRLMIFKVPLSQQVGDPLPKITDKHLIGSALHKKEMQIMINDQIGMDSKTYMNSIFFGQKLASLVSSDSKDKRDLFEKIFDSSFIDDLKEQAKDQHNEKSIAMNMADNLTVSDGNRLTDLNDQLVRDLQIQNNFDIDKKTRLETLNKQRTQKFDLVTVEEKALTKDQADLTLMKNTILDTLKEKLEVLLKDQGVHQNSLSGAKSKIITNSNELVRAKGNINTYTTELEEVKDSCISCKHPLPKSEVAAVKSNIKSNIATEDKVVKQLTKQCAVLEKEKKSAEDDLANVEAKITAQRSEIKKHDSSVAKESELKANIEIRSKSVPRLKLELESIDKDIKSEEDRKLPDGLDISKLELSITDCESCIAQHKEQSAKLSGEMDKLNWWVTKAFSSGGLKSHIFNAMLNKLNILAHKYASILGFGVQFSVDMTKASKPFKTVIYSGELEREYGDLSGGEKQRVDICIAFAMHDLISGRSDVSILILDEFTDGLDEDGVSVLFTILREKADAGKSIFVITHLDTLDSLHCKTIDIGRETTVV